MSEDLSFILNHLGEERDKYYHAVSPPVIQTSNFAFPDVASMQAAMKDEMGHYLYSRGNNPTVEILRKKLAALENTEDALVFSSGASAITATIVSFVEQGNHVVCVRNPYSWTKHLLESFLPRFGVTSTWVDGRDLSEIEAAIQPHTKVLYLESPNTMTFGLQDLKACAELARRRGVVTCVDNSHCSPVFQNPASFGIDLVLHSGTKYLNGHSDVVAGVVCGSRENIRKIVDRTFLVWGPLLGPHDAALMIRGLRTLPLRLQRSHENARFLVEKLKKHPDVEKVLWPFDPEFDQAELAARQMKGSGGLFSVLLREKDSSRIIRFVNALHRFLLAVSWGGHESLVFPMAALYDLPGRPDPSFPVNLVRFYAGLEEPEVLWQDLETGLKSLH